MPTFEIVPVHVGSRRGTSLLFCYLSEPKPLTVHYRIWVLRNGTRTIVVDSGLPPEEALRRGITDARDVTEALAEVGVDAARVTTVVLTHLHWDHASNAGSFPRATFVAQKSELDWLTSPLLSEPTVGSFYFDVEQFIRWRDSGRFHLIDGDAQIDAGVRALHVGGHTPGHQMVAVDVAGGTAVIAGDAIPLNRNFLERIPTAIHIDLTEAIGALNRARSLAPVSLFTGHDVLSELKVLG